jgi:hypothetical protein
VLDPCESSWRSEFRPSTVTIGFIRQLATLGYFTDVSTRELGEEIIPDAIMFVEFFAARLWMPPQPVLADILVKFRVQLHQLTPNTFA